MISAFSLTVIDWKLEVIDWIIRIIVAAACGCIIGWERKNRSKEAGIRTHTIVCMSTAVMMIVSKYGFTDLAVHASDYGRIAAQVISGIGFLGAGIIFYRRDFLHGLTTAAGIWATSGIGLAIGAGLLVTGVFSTFALVVLQIILHRPLKFLRDKTTSVLRMNVVLTTPEVVDKITYIFDAKKFLKFKTMTGPNGEISADIEIATEVNFSPKELYDFTKSYDFIKSLEKTDEL